MINGSFHQQLIIIKHSITMFQAYNYNFNLDTQANLDEADFSGFCQHKNTVLNQYNLSPSSLECSPEAEDVLLEENLDNSFEKGSQTSHAQEIWKASVCYIQKAADADEKGFNNDAIYRSYSSSQLPTASLCDLIKSNKLFRAKEKKDFIEDLQKETEICGLLVELMLLFNHIIFNEVAYVVYRIWSTKYSTFRNTKNQKNSSLFPSFSNFFGFEEDEKVFGSSLLFSDQSNTSEIVKASTEGIEELAKELFLSKKFKYLNLQEVRSTNINRSESIAEFTQFLKAISKAVLLSAEGIYEEEIKISSFSEEEEDGDSFTSTGAKFARLFSQIQEDCEEAYPDNRPNKHIKLE